MTKMLRYSLACWLAAATPALAAPGPGWQPYALAGTGLRVDIPTGIFERDAGAAPTGTGRKWTSADGRATLTVQTVPNPDAASPADFLARIGPPAGIVYRRVTAKFFVVSSFRQDILWYNRCNFAGRVAHCILLNYPAREKRQWDGTVTRISRTLTQ